MNRNMVKWIAMLTMFIDHIGVVFLEESSWKELYLSCRIIGRISFVLFAYLLVQGYLHTSDWKRYGGRLLVFAFLSEIPFDLAFSGKICDFQMQNVMFTLAIGICTLYFCDRFYQNSMLFLFVIIAACVTAYFLRFDYSYFGILLILIFYLFQEQKKIQMIGAAMLIIFYGGIECFGIAALPVCYWYDGKKTVKKHPRYFFYLFYPVHLLLLGMVVKLI